ncbi:MAG: T9SS type A sorting domain-containing protein [Bacteroidetes bacterium]|nr:T9SS type A sorting domain-containing protein [Bacteroidota bacterium]
MLGQNIPNPSDGNTIIPFYLPEETDLQLVVTDIPGRKILMFSDKRMSPGFGQYTITNSELKPGVYVYRLSGNSEKGSFQLVKRMIVQ